MSSGEVIVVLGVLTFCLQVLLLAQMISEAQQRRQRVPVVDPAWDAIRKAIRWCFEVPGRGLRWLRGGRDTPPGLGGP